MFERNYKVESMERDIDLKYWTAKISYVDGFLGLNKKHNQLILLDSGWVDTMSLVNIDNYHPIIQMLDNMLKIKMAMEKNNVSK